MTDQRMNPRESGEQPSDSRSLVDLSIEAEEMLQARDALRASLVRHHYALLMLARIQRKRGRQDAAHTLETRAREAAIMVWCLDNPMEALTWARDQPSG